MGKAVLVSAKDLLRIIEYASSRAYEDQISPSGELNTAIESVLRKLDRVISGKELPQRESAHRHAEQALRLWRNGAPSHTDDKRLYEFVHAACMAAALEERERCCETAHRVIAERKTWDGHAVEEAIRDRGEP